MLWQPLIDGELAQRALDRARAIGDDLGSDPRWLNTSLPDVFGGAAGVAVLFAYLDAVFPDRGYDEMCARWSTRAVDAIDETMPLALTGVVGIGWMAEHLASAGTDDPNADLDDVLVDHLDASFDGHFDHVLGLVGIGCYALERDHRASLAAILDHLARRAEPRGCGLVWRTQQRFVPPHQRASCPDGCINLGLAHGQPGVLALLARCTAIPELTSRARPLLDGALAWLLPRCEAGLGYHVIGDELAPPARTAWCYGDPGVAIALLAAGEVSPMARELALRLARRAAERSPSEAGVTDAGLCHGAAGLMLVFQRIANATDDERLRDAARAWVHHTLALIDGADGVAGCLARCEDRDEPRIGLMDGAAGIALALVAAATDLAPDWDRVLLLS